MLIWLKNQSKIRYRTFQVSTKPSTTVVSAASANAARRWRIAEMREEWNSELSKRLHTRATRCRVTGANVWTIELLARNPTQYKNHSQGLHFSDRVKTTCEEIFSNYMQLPPMSCDSSLRFRVRKGTKRRIHPFIVQQHAGARRSPAHVPNKM